MLLQPLSDDDLRIFGMSHDEIDQVHTIHTYFCRVTICLVVGMIFFSI